MEKKKKSNCKDEIINLPVLFEHARNIDHLEETAYCISDEDLEKVIKARLTINPAYYLTYLRKIVDKTVEEFIPEETLFESLEGATDSEIDEMLFRPGLRGIIREWRKAYLNLPSSDLKDRAKDNLFKIFTSMIHIGSGRERVLSKEAEEGLRHDYSRVNSWCQEIFRKSKHNEEATRYLLIKERFPDVGNDIVASVKNGLKITSPESLRDEVLLRRYRIQGRSREASLKRLHEFIADEFYPIKLLKRARKKNPEIGAVSVSDTNEGESVKTYSYEEIKKLKQKSKQTNKKTQRTRSSNLRK